MKESSLIKIVQVRPEVNGGAYPAKAIEKQQLQISAGIFTHGHEALSASVCIKEKSEKKWVEYPMEFISNDRWEFSYYPEKPCLLQFKIQGWLNHFKTWKDGFLKKQAAGQDISVELQIGAELLKKEAVKFSPKEKTVLLNYAKQLEASENIPDVINSGELNALMWRSKNELTLYPKILTVEVERTKAGFSSWYEVFPRSASPDAGRHGTFNDVKNLLPRISEMGFDVLYFPPVHPIGELKRKGKNNSLVAAADDPGSPWAIGSKEGGHKSIHKALGTLKDFQNLAKAAKKLDIEIAMDIAFQCAPDHPYVKEHPEWFTWRPDGTVQYAENPPKRYEDILPFNFETEAWESLWLELKSILDFWIDKGIRIFRIDNPHTKAFAFWEWVIAEIRAENADVVFLAEAFTRPRLMEQLAMAGFNQSYTYFTWRNTKKELEEYMTELTKSPLRDYFRPNFWPNTPDILPPALTTGGENMHIIRVILAATLSSNYGVYGPVYEFGLTEPMPGKEEYNDNEKYELRHWDWNAETRIREIMTLLNKIRKENSALQSTSNIKFAETSNDQVICYLKTDLKTNNKLIIAVNLDPFNTQSATIKLPLKKLGITNEEMFQVRDLLSQDRYRWKGESNYVQLNPFEMPAHILRIETL